MLIVGIILFQIVYIITIIPEKEMVYTNLRELWKCVRRDFIIQALKYVTIIPKQLRNLEQAL